MNKILILIPLIILTGCTHVNKTKGKPVALKKSTPKTATDTAEKPMIRYTDRQLEGFLDSVGHLPTQPLADKVAFGADSVFKSPALIDTLISKQDFAFLKRAAHKGVMSVKTARRIFENSKISYDCNWKGISLTYKRGLIPVVYTPFNMNKNGFDEFSLCIGDPGNCVSAFLCFFKGDRIIARHSGYNRNAPDLAYFKDTDGKTVVYYGKEFDNGSGIWWYNLFFYKYDGDKLIPVLNELQNANLLQPSPWGVREIWLESFIEKTNPLTIKMVYHQQLPDTSEFNEYKAKAESGPKIVDDSTTVQYTWDGKSKMLKGHFESSKITRPQILSYYLEDNELLFMNAYYGKLKDLLRDNRQRNSTLHYLTVVKNYYGDNQH